MPHSKITHDAVAAAVKKVTCKKKSPHSWKDPLHLLSRFLMKPHSVGSIWPSSQHLARAMIDGVTLKPGDVIVEYGPGTGPFTKLLRDYVAAGVDYVGIEYDKNLYKNLTNRFSEMRFHHGSAEDTASILQHYNLKPASLIVSGLPFANMPAALQERILNATQEALLEDGMFRTFSYLLSSVRPRITHFQKMVSTRFNEKHQTTTVLRNFPPARVFSFSGPIKQKSVAHL
jgi:phospholipid N-methyltransferase